MAGNTLRTLALAVALAAPVVALVGPTTVAEATSLAPLSVEQLTDASDYIVRGEITETWTEVDDKGYVWTRARLKVSDTYKGADNPSELVIDSLGGEYAGQTLHIEARAVFSKYEDALVFLTEMENGRLVPVGKFLGKYTIRRAPDVDRYYARTWHPTNQAFDARFLPHPEPENRVYLDSLMERVEARLDAGWDGKPIPGIKAERLQTINTAERRHR